MKFRQKPLFTITLTLAFSYLFYQQGFGINLFIFNGLLLGTLVFNTGKKQWTLPLICSLISNLITAFAVIYINSYLSIIANIVSLLVTVGYLFSSRLSFVVAILNTCYSLLSSFFIHCSQYFDQTSDKKIGRQKVSTNRLKALKLSSYIVPIIGGVTFLLLYTNANPKFAQVFESIRIDFFSYNWLKFTFISGFFLFGTIYQVHLNKLNAFDLALSNRIVRFRASYKNFHPLVLRYELRTAVLLLALLNIVLIVFNVLDIIYLTNDNALPSDKSYSEVVHEGVYTLIVSIVLAIGVILYFLRQNLNFHQKNRSLVYLSYAWVIQNILLVGGIAYKNHLYITEYGLTYKRIGVYIYLLLALAGLATTLYKIYKKTNHWHLIRVNSWFAFAMLAIGSIINWDLVITKYNVSHANTIDIQYLNQLSHRNLIIMYAQKDSLSLTPQNIALLESRKTEFLKKYESKKWQSWNISDHKIAAKIQDQ